ncbi:helix-turn-helix transcriptional regulator, partial [Salmonella enterica]|uniref:helix-turn-helix transcriptional regulator n=1 Tax=Salmonella enterica TaxID=28901 RepID=UPI0020C326EB
PDLGTSPHSRSAFDLINQAVSAQQVLALHYRDEEGHLSSRDIQPLVLFLWGEHLLLVSLCERREDYRCFSLDRCLK